MSSAISQFWMIGCIVQGCFATSEWPLPNGPNGVGSNRDTAETRHLNRRSQLDWLHTNSAVSQRSHPCPSQQTDLVQEIKGKKIAHAADTAFQVIPGSFPPCDLLAREQ